MKIYNKILCIFTLCMISIAIIRPCPVNASVKLSKSNITLCRYHSAMLKITGTKQAVKWRSSDSAIATVTKKGKVTAVTAGKAVITATVNKKKYHCNVTVKDYPSESILAAYGYQAMQDIVPDTSSLKIKKVWIGSSLDNVPFGMLDCTFTDKKGKNVHAYVYCYLQDELATTGFNITTSFYEKNLVLKFDNIEMSSVQQTRVTEEKVNNVKNACKYIFQNETLSVSKGKNFDVLCTWAKL